MDFSTKGTKVETCLYMVVSFIFKIVLTVKWSPLAEMHGCLSFFTINLLLISLSLSSLPSAPLFSQAHVPAFTHTLPCNLLLTGSVRLGKRRGLPTTPHTN